MKRQTVLLEGKKKSRVFVAAGAFIALSAISSSTVRAAISPLGSVTVPDVNELGLLDRTGPGDTNSWPQITNPNNKEALKQLGKAWFWDMQVGGDGIQSCASCHFHAGADNRQVNQLSPGLKRTHGGADPGTSNPDFAHDFRSTNYHLTSADFSAVNQNGAPIGLPVSELAVINAGWVADAIDGTPGAIGGKPDPAEDVNDVISSQGIRLAVYQGLGLGRVESATLAASSDGFNHDFSGNSPGIPDTVRQVEPRNSPTVVNAVYNLRNFWDGRADLFFNGVNTLGFRDPDSKVKVYAGSSVDEERLRIPFSSLASQAVGPIGSDLEMIFTGRPHRDLGKKLLAATIVPLDGQRVSTNDSLLGGLVKAGGHGLDASYSNMIRTIFDSRFVGTASGDDVCLDENGTMIKTANAGACDTAYTLMEWNFALFFGLAIQAYEATLTTEETIVDLLVGGIATGTITNGTGNRQVVVDVGPPAGTTVGMPLETCIEQVALNNRPAAQAAATNLCIQHYAQFIHPRAVSGQESNETAFPVPAGVAIGGCRGKAGFPRNTSSNADNWDWAECNSTSTLENVQASLLSIDRGMGRFFAGATGCGICHFNPELNGATVSALTGFGAGPEPEPLPPGQERKIPPEVPLERMIAFNGAVTIYDSGFYNLGVRPTAEDLSLGEEQEGVPLAFSKLAEIIQGGATPAPYDAAKISRIADDLAVGANGQNNLPIPTSPTDLSPRPFTLELNCEPGLVGNTTGNNGRNGGRQGEPNNDANVLCTPTVIPGERLLRNGAFKTSGLRNVKLTGPYLHNGSKMNLRQVVEFYKTAGHFPNLNFNNLDAGMRIFDLGVEDEAALVEMMETGLTDWRLAYEQGKFDHPEICVPNGHDSATGKTIMVGIPAVGQAGAAEPLATFEETLNGATGQQHALGDACTVPRIATNGLSDIDVPPPVAP